MLAHFTPASGAIVAMLAAYFVMALAFEATNGLHDTSNAVAMVVCTGTLKLVQATIWSGLLNLVGELVGGIAVAYGLVEILLPDVLTLPNGALAAPMLLATLAFALFWNALTRALGILTAAHTASSARWSEWPVKMRC